MTRYLVNPHQRVGMSFEGTVWPANKEIYSGFLSVKLDKILCSQYFFILETNRIMFGFKTKRKIIIKIIFCSIDKQQKAISLCVWKYLNRWLFFFVLNWAPFYDLNVCMRWIALLGVALLENICQRVIIQHLLNLFFA